MQAEQNYGTAKGHYRRSPLKKSIAGVGVDLETAGQALAERRFGQITMRFIFDMGIDLDATSRGSLVLMADQASLICVALAVLHSVAGFDSDAISRIEYSAPRAGDNDVVVL